MTKRIPVGMKGKELSKAISLRIEAIGRLSEEYERLMAKANATAEEFELLATLHDEMHLYTKAAQIRLSAPKTSQKSRSSIRSFNEVSLPPKRRRLNKKMPKKRRSG